MGELNLGDLRAMLGALETCNRRIAELVAKQGAATLLAAETRPAELRREQGTRGAAEDPGWGL